MVSQGGGYFFGFGEQGELFFGFGKHFDKVDDGNLKCMIRKFSQLSPLAFDLAVRAKMGKTEKENLHTLLTDLKYCRIRRDLEWGRKIHVKAIESQHDSNIYVGTALIRMYGKCDSMIDAQNIFDRIQKPDVVCWTALLSGYADNGDAFATLELFMKMKASGCAPDSVTYVAALKACTSLAGKRDGDGQSECLMRGRQIHSEIGFSCLDSIVQNTLIEMYGKCGSILDARLVFDSIRKPDLMSWSALLQGYADNENGHTTLELFFRMKACGFVPNSVTYIAALKACTSLAGNQGLKRGREIHYEIGCSLDRFLQNRLIDMYGKCESMVEAHCVFDEIRKPNVVSWTALLSSYADNGDGLATSELFRKMKTFGCAPNSVTYVAALKACACLEGNQRLKCGREIHSEIGDSLNIFVQNTLIGMYAKCYSMAESHLVFDRIQKPNVVSWNALLLGYADNRDTLATLKLFSKMKACRCEANSVTYIAALKACTSVPNGECLKWIRDIHSNISCHLEIAVLNTLIDVYAKCGSMVESRHVFESLKKPNVISWNVLLLGYAEHGNGLVTLELFSRMKACGFAPDSVTYMAALKACAVLADKKNDGGQEKYLKWGRKIHSQIGCDLNILVQNTLIHMYAKCGSMVDAHRAFDGIQKPNVVSWTALLLGYAENEDGRTTLELFSNMKACGCPPNSVTYIAALKAAGTGGCVCLKRGRQIHSEIDCDLNISLQNTLIDMYAKCGSMIDAHCVFDSIKNPNVISWTTLLLGYAENGNGIATLRLFLNMKASGLVPDLVTYSAALKACGLIGALGLGRKFHSEISEFNAHIVTCLVDFYAKCGSIVEAHQVFDAHSTARSVSTWTALLTGYSSFGDSDSVFNLFKAMQDQGFQPDAVTFVCVLSCCSHAGFVDKAREYIKAMPMEYRITPTVVHYTCMVDVLGRANQLNEAVCVLQKMPCNPDVVIWMTLLGACHKWKNVEIGKYAFQSLMDMNKKNAPAYVLMAHIYGSMGMWEEQERVLKARINLDSWELLGQAYVIDGVGNMVKFMDGEEDPVEVKNTLDQFLKEHNHIAASLSMSHNPICGHSERRAVVYGILKAPPGEPIRAFKNMRMCDECHGSTKTISKLLERVIMVRDTSKFHVMVNDSCSCGDYW